MPTSNRVELTRDQLLNKSIECDKTCSNRNLLRHAVVKRMIGLGLEDEERKETWMEDKDKCAAKRTIECARAIYTYVLSTFLSKKSIWKQAVYFEKTHGDRNCLV